MKNLSQRELAQIRGIESIVLDARDRAKTGAPVEPGELTVNPEALRSKPIPLVINSGEVARSETREKSLGQKVARAHREQAKLLIASALWSKYFGLIGRTTIAYGAVGCLILTKELHIFRVWQSELSAHVDAFIAIPSTA